MPTSAHTGSHGRTVHPSLARAHHGASGLAGRSQEVAPLVSPQAWLAATMRKMDSDAESDAAVRRIDAGAQAVFMTRL